jgi:ABC-type polysaccharide/polyol phosphate export permease
VRRMVLSYLLEAVGMLGIAVVVGVNFGWTWGVLPVAVYLLILGVTLGSRS